MIYFDSAATSLYKPPCVKAAVSAALSMMGNCSRGVNEASVGSAEIIYEVRQKIADLFNVKKPEFVAFMSNSTESLNVAIKGIISDGDTVVTTIMEHNSVLRPLYEMEKLGVKLLFTGCDENGVLLYDEMKSYIERHPKAVVCTHASNLTGNLIDIRKIGRWCRENDVLFILDASQTAGLFPIDMEKDCIDVLCFTGHKSLMGPQGTGGICIRDGVNIRPLITGGSGIKTFEHEHPSVMPIRLEAGTLNGHGIAGLGAAISYINETGIENIRRIEQKLACDFYKGIKDIKGIKIYGDIEAKDRCAIVSFNIGDKDSKEVGDYLSEKYDIAVRCGGHCAPLMHRHFGTEKQGMVRFSFSHFNTENEVKSAADAIKRLEYM